MLQLAIVFAICGTIVLVAFVRALAHERTRKAECIAAPGRTKKRRIVRVSNHDSRELTQFPILNSVDNYELNGRC